MLSNSLVVHLLNKYSSQKHFTVTFKSRISTARCFSTSHFPGGFTLQGFVETEEGKGCNQSCLEATKYNCYARTLGGVFK